MIFFSHPLQNELPNPRTSSKNIGCPCDFCLQVVLFGKSPRALDAWAHPNEKNRGKSITQCLGNKLARVFARLLPVIKGMGSHGFQILWQGEVSTNLKLS